MRLVADIGGTNARLALARDGQVLDGTMRSFQNDDFDSFYSLAIGFLRQTSSELITEAVVAVAGPVWGKEARLTNRDWGFETHEISERLEIGNAWLINDLTALGYALPALGSNQIIPVCGSSGTAFAEAQSLVVGVGTGFNVCPVRHVGADVCCLEAELGHVSLPASVVEMARPVLGDVTGAFPTIEECFSGRGYKKVMAMGGTNGLYAGLLGALARDLTMTFLPRGGIFFNGGVSRSVLNSQDRVEFCKMFERPFELNPDFSVPVSVIKDDTVALLGCARYTA
ncbi:MAG: glucokinase [Rhodobacteraceae bacterium]|nr:glucokinase [Paracoccaceae bacterium]